MLVVGASHSGADIAYELAAEHDTILSGVDNGQIPARVDTRRGRMGFRALAFAGKHILTMDTPMGRKMRPHVRHGGRAVAPAPAEGPARRWCRADARADGRRSRRPAAARRRSRPRRPERRLVHRLQEGLLVDRRAVRHRRRRLPRPVPRRCRVRAGALLRRAPVPAFVHVDVDLRHRSGRRAGRRAHHVAAAAVPGRATEARRVREQVAS